ncbi:MAG: DUF2490 domain-containing protein [Bacteroidia bacterium]|nr:DUF2490 domain-containing protein [Bacteroidia bacterium]
METSKISMTRTELLIVSLLLFTLAGGAQNTVNDFQLRNEVEVSIKLVKKLRLNLIPELRIDETFSIDRFLMECELAYKPWKFLEFGGSYRFIVNPRETKTTEFLHRYAFQVTFSKRIKRFEPAFRLKYTNYTEDEADGQFLRYKASLKYDVPKCKITPFLSAEAFHELTDNYLYKMRYGIGARYTIFKNNSIELSYKFDYYMKEYMNKQIITIGYKIKL